VAHFLVRQTKTSHATASQFARAHPTGLVFHFGTGAELSRARAPRECSAYPDTTGFVPANLEEFAMNRLIDDFGSGMNPDVAPSTNGGNGDPAVDCVAASAPPVSGRSPTVLAAAKQECSPHERFQHEIEEMPRRATA